MAILPTVLSVIAGSADVISFLGLGLFNAHITGNLVILAAHIVARGKADVNLMLSVPIFILVLGLMRLLVAGLQALRVGSLVPLLWLQFLLLAGLFALCGTAPLPGNPDAGSALVGCQLGVAAMAVQTALVQLALKGAPSTAVMTTNITRFIMDLGEAWLGRESGDAAQARWRAKHTWPVIIGFTVGAALGAACFAAVGLKAFALPVALALLALAMALGARHDVAH
ncbi:MAG TPA: DUF1275 family protein [Verrucomicrobiae bacterium]|nr:DUF1275 family protein [Verrucomicrobiae bacterium]